MEEIRIGSNNNPVKVLVIVGPTAVGKTAFAIHAGQKYHGEVISCDSMQIYKGMDIGTAKPGAEEMTACRHHLIDIVDPRDDFSAANFAEIARKQIKIISKEGKLPIICGGTGLYLEGVLYDIDYGSGPGDEGIRKELSSILETQGPLALHRELEILDAEAAQAIHPNNSKRVMRAIERIRLGEDKLKPYGEERKANPDIDPLIIGLERPREELYERINLRVDKMMEEGLLDEVKDLVNSGLSMDHTSMLGIGYKELLQHINGDLSLDEAVDLIKRNSRHYAKRQFTWFRRYDRIKWLDISGFGSDEEAMANMDEMIDGWLDG